MPTFETPKPIVATIDIAAGGQLQIRASDRTDTVVTVAPTNESESGDVQAAQQTQVEYVNGQLWVKAPRSKIRSLVGRPPSVEVTVDLPSDSRVEAKMWAEIRSEGRLGEATINTAAGGIRLQETGRLKLRTGAGDVSVGRAVGHAGVTTASGKVRIGEIDGAVAVKTANGDITIGEVTGDVRLNTANGDITIDRALGTVDAKTAYGKVRIGEVVRDSVAVQTGFGEVELGIREGAAAWLDLNTRFGSVRSDLDATDEPGPSDETVQVRARTGYGDILIHRAEPAK